MALRTGGSSERALCLEVWLGPMEGMRHCAPVGDGEVVRIGRRRQEDKRGVKNDLILAQGDGISGIHAEIRANQGRILLKDLNSTNGTFAGGQRISGEIAVEDGSTFVLSTTVIQVSWVDEPVVPLLAPSDDELDSYPALQGVLGAARGIAGGRAEGWVDTRHLAEALIESRDESIRSALRAASLPAGEAVKDLWSGAFVSPPLHWLRRFLMVPDGAAATEGRPTPSPTVRGIFGAAANRLAGYSEGEAKTLAVQALFVALANAAGPVAAWLKDRKVRPEPVPASRQAGPRKTSRAARTAVPVTTRDDPTVRQAPPPAAAGGDTHVRSSTYARSDGSARPTPVARLSGGSPAAPTAPAVQVPTTGDAVLDQRARAIALEIEEAASLYRFSTPEDRRSVMKSLVGRALSSIAPENRARILAQIRVQFPVTSAPPPEVSDEAPKLRARIRELETRIHDLAGQRERDPAPKKGASATTGDAGWKSVISPAGSEPAFPETEALRATIAFARNLEKFILGLVQSATTPGDATTNFRLPVYRYTLEIVLKSMQEGKAVGLEGLPEYLRELERWQVAILAAHHESPRIWFEKLWKKINPSVVEGGGGKPGGWKLGGQAGDWWNRYKEVVRGLSPDVVQDQMLQTANRTAQEEFEKLSKTKN